MGSTSPSSRFRFGRFEADPSTRELYRNGTRVPIQGKPFRILELLLRSEDGLVTRDALFQALWPEIHVERSRCLNTAMQKLRTALGEDESPIETLGSLGYRLRIPRAAGPVREQPPLRLAIQPFANNGNDSDEDGLIQGFTEELVSRLGRELPHLLVFALRDSGTGSHSTQADWRLEGTMARDASRIRISVSLRENQGQTCLWRETFDREMDSILQLREDLARSIAIATLHAMSSRARPEPEATTSAGTYRKYLAALHHFSKATESDFGRAIELLQEVIAEDGRFAPAYTSLALLYTCAAQYGAMAPDQVYPRVESLVSQSLALSRELPESHVVLGMAQMLYRADFQGAETAFRRAIKLNPSLSRAHLGLSQICTIQNRHAEAIAALRRAMELEPLAPELGTMLACAHYFAGDLPQALEQIERTLAAHPGFTTALATTGWICSALGRHEEALDRLRAANAGTPDSPLLKLQLAHALAAAGQCPEARHLLRAVLEQGRSTWISPYSVALVHIALKQPAAAFRCLERAILERDGWRVLSGVDPRLAPLASHTRFRDLLHGAGLPHPITPLRAPSRKPSRKTR